MLKTGRTLYWLKHGFDEEFAKSSPGQLLFTELVDDCLGRGDVDGINFITNNEWHKILSPRELAKRTTLLFRGNLRGLVGYCALRSKNVVRRIGVSRSLKLGAKSRNWLSARINQRAP
jgi:CelD/BcsL family acetyltransferase involved in cellulose biosynthesis